MSDLVINAWVRGFHLVNRMSDLVNRRFPFSKSDVWFGRPI